MESIIGLVGSCVAMFILGGIAYMAFRQWYFWIQEENEANAAMDVIMNSNNYKEGKEEMSNEEKTAEMAREETCNLMVNALNNLGCQPEVLDDKSLNVSYQGENFHMEFGGSLVQVWDPAWSTIKADDPELANLKEAVNATNFGFGPTVVMTAPDENGIIYFHTRYGMLMQDGIRDIEGYVQHSLNMFFGIKQEVTQNFQRLRVEQQQRQTNRRPIGFQTNSNENENN